MKKIILIITILLLTGCYNYTEINDLAFVSSIGIDYDVDSEKFLVTYEILNDNNRKRFTKKQQAVIDKAKSKLTQQDPTALQKIQDAGTLAHRIEDADKVYNTLLNNGDLAIAYFDAQDELRNRNAISESLQEDIRIFQL